MCPTAASHDRPTADMQTDRPATIAGVGPRPAGDPVTRGHRHVAAGRAVGDRARRAPACSRPGRFVLGAGVPLPHDRPTTVPTDDVMTHDPTTDGDPRAVRERVRQPTDDGRDPRFARLDTTPADEAALQGVVDQLREDLADPYVKFDEIDVRSNRDRSPSVATHGDVPGVRPGPRVMEVVLRYEILDV